MIITAGTLTTITTTATGATEFTFVPSRPLHQRAGQAGLVIVPGGGAKPFTLSSDAQADTVSIATSLASGSRIKKALGALQAGDRVTFVGPFGGLPIAPPADEQVWIAQGIGITPFLSLARTAVVGTASLLQVGAAHFFDEVAARVADAQHVAHRGELQQAVARAVAAHPSADWSISGRSDFVASVAAQLRTAGVPARRIHKAAFVGMRDAAATAASTLPVAVAA